MCYRNTCNEKGFIVNDNNVPILNTCFERKQRDTYAYRKKKGKLSYWKRTIKAERKF